MTSIKRNKKNVRFARKMSDNSVEKMSSFRVRPIKEKQTRIEILQTISDLTKLKRVEVEAVFTEMAKLVKGHMKKQGSGEVMLPKLGIKIRRVRRKPTRERKMVSPLTGKEVLIESKPARNDVKVLALKTLKEAVHD